MTFTKEELEIILDSLGTNHIELQNKINEVLAKLEGYDLCLWQFGWDCGRQGEVTGIFKATKNQVENIIGQEVYFGEILGKHSDIYGAIDKGEITLVSDNPAYVLNASESGYNPFEYWTCSSCGREINPNTGICEECFEEA